MGKTKILYLSYNGMLEALGTSQVLSYLYKLSEDYDYYLISLEKPEDFNNKAAVDVLKDKLEAHGIHWIPILYKTSKTGKLLNFLNFTKTALAVIKKENILNIHCRSYVTAVAAFFIKKRRGLSYLFDTRSFAFDERADVGGLDRSKPLYKLAKKFEKKLYQNASGIVMLSKVGKETILNNELFIGGENIKNIEIIPTCVDLDRFTFHKRDYNKETITIGYIGTATGWYDFEKTAATLSAIKKFKKIKFLVFNNNQYGQHAFIRQMLEKYHIEQSEYHIEKVSFSHMPARLAEIDIALFYIHPFFSKKASAATKLGELLASGIPVLTNNEVGDHEYYIENYKVGKILEFEQIDTYNFTAIFDALINEETAFKCRSLSEKYFSLEEGVTKYKKIYSTIFK